MSHGQLKSASGARALLLSARWQAISQRGLRPFRLQALCPRRLRTARARDRRHFSRSGWASFASTRISFPATWDRPWFQSHLPWAKQAIHPHHPITPAPPIEVVGLALGHQGPLWKRSGLQCWGCLSGGGAKASQEPAKLLACHQGRRTRLLAAREVAGPAHATRPVRRFASHSARGCCAAHR